jgi:ATP-dependent phosphofructokinase / diphosphate-dependent phosphofructokinase
MRRIGILTSGGDCAGLNAAMRSIFYRAKKYGMEVVGIKDGTLGLIQRPVNSIELNYQIVSGALFREGGTFLGTTIKEILFILRVRTANILMYLIKLLKVINY